MVQFSILSGKAAGSEWIGRHFNVRIGRAPSADLRLEDEGVWDEHLILDLDPAAGFIIETSSNALATINDHPLQRSILGNGDLIELGSVKMQFSFSRTRQAGLRLREGLTWAAIAAISLGQILLVYWLIY